MLVSGYLHVPATLHATGNASGAHLIGHWVRSRASMDTVNSRKITCPCQDSNPSPQSPCL